MTSLKVGEFQALISISMDLWIFRRKGLNSVINIISLRMIATTRSTTLDKHISLIVIKQPQ